MGELSIKVTIGNRTYPLTIQREEEENIRKAAKLCNENVKKLEDNYAVRDKQDLLAMTALQFATQTLETPAAKMEEEGEELGKKLDEVEQHLTDYLNR